MPWLSDADRDPVALLRGVDLDVERLVVDPDAAIAAVGDRREVADHVRLEIARGGLHRRLLRAVDRLERDREHALAALGRGELLLPGDQPLGLAGDLFGVDGVGIDPGAGVRLVVAGALDGRLLVADLDLETLAGARLLGDRSERLERARPLGDLQGRGVARGRQRRRRLPCRRARRAGRRAGRSGRRGPPRGRAGPRPRQGRAGPARSSCAFDFSSAVDQLGLHLRATAQPPVDLDVAQLRLVLDAAPQPQRDAGQDQSDDRDDPADDLDGGPEIGDAEGLEQDRAAGQQDPDQRPARPRCARAAARSVRARPRTRPSSRWRGSAFSSRIRAVEGAQPLDTRRAARRQRVGRRMASWPAPGSRTWTSTACL